MVALEKLVNLVRDDSRKKFVFPFDIVQKWPGPPFILDILEVSFASAHF